MNLDHEDIRRALTAKRVAAGANTPIGHRCSNLIELLDNYRGSAGDDRIRLEYLIRKQMAELLTQ